MDKKERYKSLKEELSKLEDKSSNLALLLIDTIHEMEAKYPELIVGDDERIRKEIIKTVELYGPKTGDSKLYNDMIVWLEKQGEQKPSWSEEDEFWASWIYETLRGFDGNDLEAYRNQDFIEECGGACKWFKAIKDRVITK